ncbi:dynamin family protein [Bhargavaea massiliensis]|uniref:dynamin family protein n=1 Tax=Bhargavaea massiliensis TaxID=2697500 RepID=UPI001BCCC0DB|nr:dynamin family protein [Bhargavaea massiliensis]
MELKEYTKRKSSLLEVLRSIKHSTKELGLIQTMKKINVMEEEVQHSKFNIVVVGEFSRGKSTFINAIMGEKVLPSKAMPTTATLNLLSFGEDKNVTVHFKDGTKEIIDVEDFKKYNAPKEPLPGDEISLRQYEEKMKEISSIDYAQISYPVDYLKNGVCIIDTPGTNDLDPAREALTNSIIPTSDIAILLLSSVKILSESEMSLLKNRLLENDIQKVFLVINFKDQLKTEEEQRKVIEYTNENVKDIFGEPKIYLVSALEALRAKRRASGVDIKDRRGRPLTPWTLEESGFHDLEQDIEAFIEENAGHTRIDKFKSRLSKLIENEIFSDINMEQYSLENTQVNIQNEIKEIKKELNKLEATKKKVIINIKSKIEILISELVNEFETGIKSDQDILLKSLYYQQSKDQIIRQAEDIIAKQDKNRHLEYEKKFQQQINVIIEEELSAFLSKKSKINYSILNLGAEQNTKEHLTVDFNVRKTIADEFYEISSTLTKSNEFSNKVIGAVAFAAGVFAEIGEGIVKAFVGYKEYTWIDEFNNSIEKKYRSRKKQYEKQLKESIKQFEDTVKVFLENEIEQSNFRVEKQISIKNLSHHQVKIRKEFIENKKNEILSCYETLEEL